MSEKIAPRSTADEHDSSEDFALWEAEMNNTPPEAAESQSNPELSPMAGRIQRAANRISGFLEKRALNKAHKEALAEYRSRDRTSYMSHLEKVASGTDNTRAELSASLHLSGEYALDSYESAKSTIQGIGRAALYGGKEVGVAMLGAGIMAAEAGHGAVNKVRRGAETASFRMNMAADHLTERAKRFGAEQALNATTSIKNYVTDKMDSVNIIRAQIHDTRFNLSMRGKAAKESIIDRGKRFASGAYNILDKTTDVMAAGINMVGNKGMEVARGTEKWFNTRRAAGRAALDAYRLTRDTHNDQNKIDASVK